MKWLLTDCVLMILDLYKRALLRPVGQWRYSIVKALPQEVILLQVSISPGPIRLQVFQGRRGYVFGWH